jgi:hypothetical protein
MWTVFLPGVGSNDRYARAEIAKNKAGELLPRSGLRTTIDG